MQRSDQIRPIAVNWLLALLFAAGLLLAGSDCAPPLWPWPNIVGTACIAACALLSNRFAAKAKSARRRGGIPNNGRSTFFFSSFCYPCRRRFYRRRLHGIIKPE